MTDLELRGISSILSKLVKESVSAAKAELRAEYQQFVREHIDSLPPGDPGKDAVPVDVEALAERAASLIKAPEPVDTDALVLRVAELFRQPEDGKPGKDGESVDPSAIANLVYGLIRKPQDGKDADPELVRQLVSTEVTRAVSSLPAAKDGAPGAKGEPGEAGKSIHPDTVALMVREAFDRMPKPENGKQGEPGRDALQIDPITVDPEKSYPRGTVATYNGGTVRANRTTTPGPELSMPEWDVLLDGVVGFTVTQLDDLRTVIVQDIRTSGKMDKFILEFPVLLDRGGYKSGEAYTRGDVVSREGQMWICQAEATTAAPGMANNDWRLSVRRGQNGKDLRPTEPLPPNGPIRLK